MIAGMRDMMNRDMVKRDMVKRDVMKRRWFSQELPSFSRVSRGFHPSSLPLLPSGEGKLEPPLSTRERGGGEGIEHVSEPANAQLDAASWDGRGGCETDGVVARAESSHHPRHCVATPPRAGGELRGQNRLTR